MSYQRGFLRDRITLWNPTHKESEYGGWHLRYIPMAKAWANVSFVKGQRALRNGEIDVYQTVMVRLDCHAMLTKRTRIEYDGRFWIIDSFNRDLGKNECQLTMFEIDDINKEEMVVEPEPIEPEPEPVNPLT